MNNGLGSLLILSLYPRVQTNKASLMKKKKKAETRMLAERVRTLEDGVINQKPRYYLPYSRRLDVHKKGAKFV